jgi:hypothetical protein
VLIFYSTLKIRYDSNEDLPIRGDYTYFIRMLKSLKSLKQEKHDKTDKIKYISVIELKEN